jgi:hypothetical protein
LTHWSDIGFAPSNNSLGRSPFADVSWSCLIGCM